MEINLLIIIAIITGSTAAIDNVVTIKNNTVQKIDNDLGTNTTTQDIVTIEADGSINYKSIIEIVYKSQDQDPVDYTERNYTRIKNVQIFGKDNRLHSVENYVRTGADGYGIAHFHKISYEDDDSQILYHTYTRNDKYSAIRKEIRSEIEKNGAETTYRMFFGFGPDGHFRNLSTTYPNAPTIASINPQDGCGNTTLHATYFSVVFYSRNHDPEHAATGGRETRISWEGKGAEKSRRRRRITAEDRGNERGHSSPYTYYGDCLCWLMATYAAHTSHYSPRLLVLVLVGPLLSPWPRYTVVQGNGEHVMDKIKSSWATIVKISPLIDCSCAEGPVARIRSYALWS
ncbi:hypothetical protein KQX54_008073 [Cotesia glomerata]|uniref:Uncharacterized protein n=1 Tax=Cotesia glomerata TaxID=32391 RepID=A0AAV7I817_COTGL|nr:hypothetical protein KQX54_008073 [Cotesia glomerata]